MDHPTFSSERIYGLIFKLKTTVSDKNYTAF